MNTAGAVILSLVLLLLAAAVSWVIFTRVRAARLGLPPPPWKSYIPFLGSSSGSYAGPSPAPGGIVGWIRDRIRLLRYRNTRTAAGAYEGPAPYNAGYASTGPAPRGFDHLDDDPWDARVGAYHPDDDNERELGLVPPRHRPDGEAYQMNLPVTPAAEGLGHGGHGEERGRTRSRSPGPATAAARPDPFGDDAEPSNMSLRGVSPRPMPETDNSFAGRKARGDEDRRSMFREEM